MPHVNLWLQPATPCTYGRIGMGSCTHNASMAGTGTAIFGSAQVAPNGVLGLGLGRSVGEMMRQKNTETLQFYLLLKSPITTAWLHGNLSVISFVRKNLVKLLQVFQEREISPEQVVNALIRASVEVFVFDIIDFTLPMCKQVVTYLVCMYVFEVFGETFNY